MYNLIIAFLVGAAATALTKVAGFSIWAALLPGTLAFIGTYLLLARRIVTKVQKLSSLVQAELSSSSQNPREQKSRVERAVKLLESGLSWDKWQFLLAPQLHGQIGSLKYMTGDLEGALPHFARSSSRDPMAKAMEGALFYRRKDYSRMEKAFEAAVKAGKKEPMVWAAYAWCQLQLKERDKALQVLGRAVEANPSEEKLKRSLTDVQNDKRLKMRPYEPMWWQFGLEAPPMQQPGGRMVRYRN